MNDKGIFIKSTPNIREIWVQREDEVLEYKLWVIFSVSFKKETEKKIFSFLNLENERHEVNDLPESSNTLMNIASEYTNLKTISKLLPPRLIGIEANRLNNMDTELITDKNNFIFGDSVGGLSPNKPIVHNEELFKSIQKARKILINPGVLTRIEIMDENKKTYIFQLAEKNLRKKSQIFYKPIGGHLKYKDNFIPFIKEFDLELKSRNEEQDAHDLSLYVKPNNFVKLSDILKKDLLSEKEYFYIENPQISIYRELQEELGPIFASDGISLLDEEDMKLVNIKS